MKTVISEKPSRRGEARSVPANKQEADNTAGWTFIGGGSIDLLEAPDKTYKTAVPDDLKIVIFFDDHTTAIYNGPDGQPLNRYRGPGS